MAAKRSTLTNVLKETYDQTVNGVHYVIKPGETIELDRYEAVNVVGHYCGPTKVCLEIKHLPYDEDDKTIQRKVPKVYCAEDGKEFDTKEALQEYLKKRGK